MEIKELKIYAQNLSKQVDFYSKKLGFELLYSSNVDAIFKIGKSKLKIVESNLFQPYHFAINIPCNKDNEALEWLKQRVEVFNTDNVEIHDFDFWNAKAIYFYDAEKNIVEFIARKNLNNQSQENFTVNSLLEISEIGIPVNNNIEKTFDALKKIAPFEIYDGGFEKFCAIGDENGLFICIDKNIKKWFPIGDKANYSEFQIKFENNGQKYALEFINGEIKEMTNQ